VLTLYLTPVIYLYFDGLQQRLRRRRGVPASHASGASGELGTAAHAHD
jgi:hypothetical protein